LSEPRFEKLALVLETQGPERQGPGHEEVALCFKLRKRGQTSRARTASRARGKSASCNSSSVGKP
jgi:hypothetical protein